MFGRNTLNENVKKRTLLAVIAVALICVLSACGSSGSIGSGTQGSSSQAVNLMDYVTVNFSGMDGSGYASVDQNGAAAAIYSLPANPVPMA